MSLQRKSPQNAICNSFYPSLPSSTSFSIPLNSLLQGFVVLLFSLSLQYPVSSPWLFHIPAGSACKQGWIHIPLHIRHEATAELLLLRYPLFHCTYTEFEVTGAGEDMLGHIHVLLEWRSSRESPWEIPVIYWNQDRSHFQQISWDPRNAVHGSENPSNTAHLVILWRKLKRNKTSQGKGQNFD